MNRFTTPILLISLGFAISAKAFVPIGTSLDDPNNYGTFSGETLQSITLNGVTYSTDALINISLTAFSGASQSVLLTKNGASTNPTAQERRDFLETDWHADTGIINPSATAGSVQADFDSPVLNRAGADMFLYEINGTASQGDPFQITINGTTLTVSGTDYGDSGVSTSLDDVLQINPIPATLNDLLNDNSTLGATSISQNILGVGIDFSDFGVADGATVSSFSYDSDSSASFDPVIVAAVPEPGTYALMMSSLVILGIVLRRRQTA